MSNLKKFKHMANVGDAVSIMPALKKFYELTGNKAVLCQQLNVKGAYPIGSKHPSVDEAGNAVLMNNHLFNMLRPLYLSQEYIGGMEIYEGQHIDFDLDDIRLKTFVNLGKMAIQQWPMLAYPDLAINLAKPWISVEKHRSDFSNIILCNFTDRYRNHTINYFFLKKYESNLLFAGTKKERDDFCREWKLNIPQLIVADFLELAQVIKSCRFLLANQSLCWNIAEALKSPRILEMSPSDPNCQPFIGENSFGFYHQVGLEYYVDRLFTKEYVMPDKDPKPCPCCGHVSKLSFVKKERGYFRCESCNTIFVPGGLPNDNMVGGGQEEQRNMQQNQERLRRFVTLSGASARMLDFGCGHGMLVKDARNAGLAAFGYDKYNPEFETVPDATFNLISAVEVIEHLSPPFEELDLIHRLLAPEGILYIETSFTDLWEEPLSEVPYIEPSVGHATIFSHKGLDILMAKKGFKPGDHINQNVRIYVK